MLYKSPCHCYLILISVFINAMPLRQLISSITIAFLTQHRPRCKKTAAAINCLEHPCVTQHSQQRSPAQHWHPSLLHGTKKIVIKDVYCFDVANMCANLLNNFNSSVSFDIQR